ncbi:hypothetical protein EZV73_23415 [Acidaminobacter sp. JC074]|uniref:hypothetical protein n=1 Tax=Acidaminobacter sp. JC074 TaxID=2530199 RepID=UPI001F1006B3|nr:hypothetical protein [Acidaminobacter sp. JC074]MCH4890550.1 hypothetical protein [Acidaminobacter sp. JC074]
MPIDERDRLKDQPFDYKVTKAGKVMIYYENRQIMILSEKQAGKLVRKLDQADEFNTQLLLAKATGHFKHGNER